MTVAVRGGDPEYRVESRKRRKPLPRIQSGVCGQVGVHRGAGRDDGRRGAPDSVWTRSGVGRLPRAGVRHSEESDEGLFPVTERTPPLFPVTPLKKGSPAVVPGETLRLLLESFPCLSVFCTLDGRTTGGQ